MTNEQMKNWIDNATYTELLSRWRFEPMSSQWFQGEIGDYYVSVMNKVRAETSEDEKVIASKNIGW